MSDSYDVIVIGGHPTEAKHRNIPTANHPMNWKNKTIWTGDNLGSMRGMNSESVDLIYLDPPFNSNHNYAAPIGSEAAGAEFKDTWTLNDIDNEWHGLIADAEPALYEVIRMSEFTHSKSMKSYLIYMGIRLLELKRILKNIGSIYLHCDPTAGHYLKIAMDAVFGKRCFRNEIVWCYTGPSASKKNFPSKHDLIFRYCKDTQWTFNFDAVRVPYVKSETGKTKGIFKSNHALNLAGKIPEDWWSDISPVGRIKKERLSYPTQKPLKLLERIIKTSSNQGDIVFDPFCGCATTLVAADRLRRQWVGIDLSPKATELVTRRIKNDQGVLKDITPRDDLPRRTDLGKIANYQSQETKNFLYGQQDGVCLGCDIHFPFRNMTVDHKVPRSKGGGHHIENLQLLCAACNSQKGDKTDAQWKAYRKKHGV